MSIIYWPNLTTYKGTDKKGEALLALLKLGHTIIVAPFPGRTWKVDSHDPSSPRKG